MSPHDLEKVIKYIENQHEHHKNISFQDEYRDLLRSMGVDFDERYIWD